MKPSILLSCLLLASTVFGENVLSNHSLSFAGTSTLHDFEGTSATQSPATWEINDSTATLSIPKVVFAVKTLTTDHKKRDKNMLKMFEPNDYPSVSGKIDGWKLSSEKATEQKFTLDIHGQTLEVPVSVDAYKQTEAGFLIQCHFTLSLKACDLKRPSVMGLIRVGDEVTVQVETLLTTP